jgi:DNA-3-methyladenine glycosylase II
VDRAGRPAPRARPRRRRRAGDLRVRKAVQAAYRLDHLPTQQEVLAIAGKWRLYRSLATSYLFSATFAQAKTPPAAQRKT